MGWGVHITDGEHIYEESGFAEAMPQNTNNIAEYRAIIMVLQKMVKKENCEIFIFGDSMLVVNQMNEKWGSSGGAYYPYMIKAKVLLKEVKSKNNVYISWIPRGKNELADIQSKKLIKQVKDWKK